MDETAPPPRRKIPRLVLLLCGLFSLMSLRTTRMDHILTDLDLSRVSNDVINAASTFFGEEGELPSRERTTLSPAHRRLSLQDLLEQSPRDCPSARSPPSNTSTTNANPSRIPRLIHQADGISDCPPEKFQQNSRGWRDLLEFDYIYHSPRMMETLFYQDWPEFPHLTGVLQCLTDAPLPRLHLWKAIVLWEFGGVVVDFDVHPLQDFAKLWESNDQGIVFQTKGWPLHLCQVLEPKHPLAYYTVMHILHRVNQLRVISTADWNSESGMSAFHEAFWFFVGVDLGSKNKPKGGYKRLGLIPGRYNRTVRISSHDNVIREDVLALGHDWRSTHYPALLDSGPWNVTCMSRTYDYLAHRGPAVPTAMETTKSSQQEATTAETNVMNETTVVSSVWNLSNTLLNSTSS